MSRTLVTLRNTLTTLLLVAGLTLTLLMIWGAPAQAALTPEVLAESFSGVGSTSATVSAKVNANGAPATFSVEYGPTAAYGLSTSATTVGSSGEAVGVIAHLDGLQPGVSYHFRFLASNETGTMQGADVTFTTLQVGVLGLPDDRGYEMVTPVDSEDAQLYIPQGDALEGEEAIGTSYPVRAAADGHAVVYVGEPNAEGNGNLGYGGGNEYMATRDPSGGWTQQNIQPAGFASPVYMSFSDDLSMGVLTSNESLSAGAPNKYDDLYTRDSTNRDLQPFFTVKPPNRSSYEFGAANLEGYVFQGSLRRFYAGASLDFKRLFFEANDSLTANAVDGGEHENNLYESVEGALRLVNVLPNGSASPNASFGAPPAPNEETENSDHAISADGSRVFWTDMNTGALYVREDGASTSLVDEHATFSTASSDGSRVLYAKGGDLYQEELSTGVRRDLTPGGQVLGIAGSSEDAEYVYFVAEGILAPGATSRQPNLYLHHGDTTTLIATLASTGEDLGKAYGSDSFDDWSPGLGHRTAEATPDGHALVFMSVGSLTGYDNHNEENEAVSEVYVYDASSGDLSCVSCSPSGERPTSRSLAGNLSVTGSSVFTGSSNTYQLRLISEDGDRVAFQSRVPLVAQDVNGRADVYEWERDGTGSCHLAPGCDYLLSDGSSDGASYLVDASADGSDVFIVTSAQLVGQDQNELYDVYDARIGAVRPLSPPQCTGSGCQGVPAAPPIFAAPSSVTFNGIGNFSAPVKTVAKKKVKAKHKRRVGKKRKGTGKHGKRRGRPAKGTALRKGTALSKSGRGGR